MSVTFPVAEANLAVEYLLIGLPVLQYLGMETKKRPEERQSHLDTAGCFSKTDTTTGLQGGKAGRLMIARINCAANDAVEPVAQLDQDQDGFPVNVYKVREEVDPFPDASLLDTVD